MPRCSSGCSAARQLVCSRGRPAPAARSTSFHPQLPSGGACGSPVQPLALTYGSGGQAQTVIAFRKPENFCRTSAPARSLAAGRGAFPRDRRPRSVGRRGLAQVCRERIIAAMAPDRPGISRMIPAFGYRPPRCLAIRTSIGAQFDGDSPRRPGTHARTHRRHHHRAHRRRRRRRAPARLAQRAACTAKRASCSAAARWEGTSTRLHAHTAAHLLTQGFDVFRLTSATTASRTPQRGASSIPAA